MTILTARLLVRGGLAGQQVPAIGTAANETFGACHPDGRGRNMGDDRFGGMWAGSQRLSAAASTPALTRATGFDPHTGPWCRLPDGVYRDGRGRRRQALGPRLRPAVHRRSRYGGLTPIRWSASTHAASEDWGTDHGSMARSAMSN